MEQNYTFRTAGFGGFNRQDVLDYIQKITAEHAQKRDALSKELDVVQGQLFEAQCAAADLEQAKARIAELEAVIPADGPSYEELTAQLAEAKEQAQRYETLRGEYADIELDARKRAADIIAKAEAQAADITAEAQRKADGILAAAQDQAEKTMTNAEEEAMHIRVERRHLLSRTQRDFATSTEDLRVSVSGALREIDTIRQTMLDLRTTFEENAAAVESLCTEE